MNTTITTPSSDFQQFIDELSTKMMVEKVTNEAITKTIYNIDRVKNNLQQFLGKTVEDVEFYLIQPNSLVDHQTALVVYREVPDVIPAETPEQPLDFKTVTIPSAASDHVIVALSNWLFATECVGSVRSDIFVKTDNWIHFYIARSNSAALKPELTPRDPKVVHHDALQESLVRTSKEIDKLYEDLDNYLMAKERIRSYFNVSNPESQLV